MNPNTMANSLSNSIYNAVNTIGSYQSDLSYGAYNEFHSQEYRMDETPKLNYSDFMNNDSNPPIDEEFLQAFTGTDYHPLVQLSLPDVDMSFIQSELMTSDSHDTDQGGSDGTEDIISDYSDSGSCFSESYEHNGLTIMGEKTEYIEYSSPSYHSDDLLSCQPLPLFNKEGSVHENPSQKKKPGRKKGQTSKVLHLWEFIRDLLKDPHCNGNIIQWENKEDGVFRVVKSSEVASLWGKKKKNKKAMTYEKMSRSMRYSRKEGYFLELPKNSGYPKKLCFRFGPKSTGWQ